MREKIAFVFFVCQSSKKWRRNRESFLFYINKISVNENNQIEVISITEENYQNKNETSDELFLSRAMDCYRTCKV